MRSARRIVQEHVDAFNAHDTRRLITTLTEDVHWVTGSDEVNGRANVAELFDDWLWGHDPRLDVTRTVSEGETVAVECVEHMVVDGTPVRFPIAIFFTVRSGLLLDVRVYREGSADLPS